MRNPRAVARFVEEAQTTGQLQHPGIVPVHEMGRLLDGRLYFTMLEVRGRSFDDLLRSYHGTGSDEGPSDGTVSFRRLVDIFLKVCEAVAYALFNLEPRGRMFVSPGDPVYEGMIIGIHSRDNDLVVNPIRTKQLTNIRAAGKDEAILLTPPIQLTLEYAVEFIGDDELAEITPKSIRLRKRFLKEHERKRADRAAA